MLVRLSATFGGLNSCAGTTHALVGPWVVQLIHFRPLPRSEQLIVGDTPNFRYNTRTHDVLLPYLLNFGVLSAHDTYPC